jgi:SAM-dependent methyltransferase
MNTDHLAQFFDTVSLWWGSTACEEDDRLRLQEIRLNTPKMPLDILDLGAGCGGTAVHCAKAGHHVTAIELSAQRAHLMRQLAQDAQVEHLTILQADMYQVTLPQRYDVICYWNGFGVGEDQEQRHLLTRMRQAWLRPTGFILLDVFSPWWWAQQAGEKILLTKLPHVPASVDNYRMRQYDPVNNRFYECWQPVDGHYPAVCQHYRCYTPVDLRLLLEGTGLSVAYWKVNFQHVDVAIGTHDTHHPSGTRMNTLSSWCRAQQRQRPATRQSLE